MPASAAAAAAAAGGGVDDGSSPAPIFPHSAAAADQTLRDQLSHLGFPFVVSDCTQPDMPIVYASSAFLSLTGFELNEVRA